MNPDILIEHQAKKLPKEWDDLACAYFQRRSFLSYLEEFNPCQQRYYLAYEQNQLISAAVVYTLRLDLLTFLKIKSPIRMKVVGVPCSISCPGIFGNFEACDILKEEIYRCEKGLCLFLNLFNPFNSPNHVNGPTLPSVVIKNHYKTWDEYVEKLRANYRRRLKKIVHKPDGIELKKTSTKIFTVQMYEQYLQVFHKSKAKLEKLSNAFFRNLPDPFQIITCQYYNTIIGWVIILFDNSTLYFFMGGVDYGFNKIYQTYFRLCAAIVEEGIQLGAQYIDLGQTAEIPKMRLGGNCQSRFLEAGHSTPVLNKLLKISEKLLVYHRNIPEAHIFKRAL